MLEPRKRTAIDGKTWWCVFDTELCFGKYETKKECKCAISQKQIRMVNNGR